MDHVDKYYWVINHPKLGGSTQAIIELQPQKVNPVSDEIDLDHPELNTKFEWWVELSVWDAYERTNWHDWVFDCGGATAEEAVDTLYRKVLTAHGDYAYV